MEHKILSRENIRTTAIRLKLLRILVNSEYALTFRDLNDRLEQQFDRVTIYRTLNTFLNHDIIHRIVDGAESKKYAMSDIISEGYKGHSKSHMHFKCERCNKVYCLPIPENESLDLPDGFEYRSCTTMVKGICKRCKFGNT